MFFFSLFSFLFFSSYSAKKKNSSKLIFRRKWFLSSPQSNEERRCKGGGEKEESHLVANSFFEGWFGTKKINENKESKKHGRSIWPPEIPPQVHRHRLSSAANSLKVWIPPLPVRHSADSRDRPLGELAHFQPVLVDVPYGCKWRSETVADVVVSPDNRTEEAKDMSR